MKLIPSFDPSVATSGTIDTLGVNPNEQLMLYNDSLYGLKLTFADGSIDVIPPSWNKDFILKTVPMGKVTWETYVTITATNYPVSLVYGSLYEPDEHVSSVNAGMQRGFTLTGGNVVSGLTSSIVNTGNPAPTNIIQVQPSDVASNVYTIYADSSGNLYVQADNAGTVTKLLNITGGATPSVSIVGGVKGGLHLGQLAQGDTLDTDGNGNTYIKSVATSNQTVNIQPNGSTTSASFPASGGVVINNNTYYEIKNAAGTTKAIIGVDASDNVVVNAVGTNGINFNDNTGALVANIGTGTNGITFYQNLTFSNGAINFFVGEIGRVNHFTGTGTGTYNHGLGSTPGWVAPIVSVSGSATQGYDTAGTTTVHVTLGSSLAFVAYAIRP